LSKTGLEKDGKEKMGPQKPTGVRNGRRNPRPPEWLQKVNQAAWQGKGGLRATTIHLLKPSKLGESPLMGPGAAWGKGVVHP